MDQQHWLFWAQIAQGVGAVGSFVVSGFIAVLIYKYTQRRDRLDFLLRRWSDQQALNLAEISSDDNLRSFEEIVYGKTERFDVKRARKRYHLFTVLNMVQSQYFAMEHKVITKADFENYARPSLTLLVRERDEVIYLLTQRGYGLAFREAVTSLLEGLDPPEPNDKPKRLFAGR
jgi:hypothetical protein